MPRLHEFTAKIKIAAFERANGHCEECGCRLVSAQYDHILPVMLGGESTMENIQVLCIKCHRLKTTQADIPRIAKTKRIAAKHRGAKTTRNPLPGSKASGWRKRFDGTVERRPS